MARLVKKEFVGMRTVVELSTASHSYLSKIGVINHNCDECKRLHLMPDEVTPRLWKMSELSHGYHKKGEEFPSVRGLHPHCRCSLNMLPSVKYAFNEKGQAIYNGAEHNEWKKQRGE